MPRQYECSDLDELLGLKDWLLKKTDDELKSISPSKCVSRDRMLATLNELINQLAKGSRN
jgi:hypothetical protein